MTVLKKKNLIIPPKYVYLPRFRKSGKCWLNKKCAYVGHFNSIVNYILTQRIPSAGVWEHDYRRGRLLFFFSLTSPGRLVLSISAGATNEFGSETSLEAATHTCFIADCHFLTNTPPSTRCMLMLPSYSPTQSSSVPTCIHHTTHWSTMGKQTQHTHTHEYIPV